VTVVLKQHQPGASYGSHRQKCDLGRYVDELKGLGRGVFDALDIPTDVVTGAAYVHVLTH
jgi:hypothetical protein